MKVKERAKIFSGLCGATLVVKISVSFQWGSKCSCFDAFVSPLPGRAIPRILWESQHQYVGVPADGKTGVEKFLYRNSEREGFT